MARQFIFKENDITEVSEAYLNDVPGFRCIDKNICISNQLYRLTGEELKHIHVLRYKVEDSIVINNMQCNILHISKDNVIVDKVKDLDEKGKPNISLTLYPAFLKSDKMDYLVQKAVELGTTDITPFFSSNTVVKLEDKDKSKRREKLQKIAIEATKQCGRTDEVNVHEFLNFNNLLNSILKYDFCIFAYEKEKLSIKSVINNLKKENTGYKDIAIVVGPEGGFTSKEANELSKISNVHIVSLGERILRAETASVNLITILMYEFDNN